ncbi:MAG: glycerophosphoryl diester phosphodiesterase membrane domain-containing protein, partial [Terracidiphilus sp.]|nr:glycerophosphoryl diester phosphodiesterase membrane domain-containing protein [Terracidiphilus sp.]
TILMGLRYALALPACVVEDLKARPALRRGIQLSKGARGRIFVLGLLIGVIKLGLVMVTQLFILIAAFKHHGQLGPGLTALSQVISFFTTSFLGPIYATGITLFYYDQRVRKEGFDIEWMMQAAGLTAPEVEAAADSLPPQAGEIV